MGVGDGEPAGTKVGSVLRIGVPATTPVGASVGVAVGASSAPHPAATNNISAATAISRLLNFFTWSCTFMNNS